MKWINHKILTFSIIWTITDSITAGIISAFGSIFPDAIEFFVYYIFPLKRTHRTWSHWFVIYLIPLILISISHYLILNQTFAFFIKFFLIGALFHIAEDSITGKVPGIILKKKIGFRFFKTGSFEEYLFTFTFSSILITTKLFNLKV